MASPVAKPVIVWSLLAAAVSGVILFLIGKNSRNSGDVWEGAGNRERELRESDSGKGQQVRVIHPDRLESRHKNQSNQAARSTKVPPISGDIFKIGKEMTPAQAKAFLERLRTEVPNLSHRSSLGASIIDILCRNGNQVAAWNMIDSGYGVSRDFQMRAYFMSCHGQDALNKISSLVDSDDKLRASEGFLSNRGFEELLAMDYSPLIAAGIDGKLVANELTMNLHHGDLTGLENAAASKEENRLIVEGAVAMVGKGIFSPNDLYSIMKIDQSTDGFEKMAILERIPDGGDANRFNELQGIRASILDGMILSDAPRTMNLLVAERSVEYDGLIGYAMQQWLIYDNDGASGWQAENDSGLSSAGRDGVAAGFVRYALDHGEKEGAALWLDRIQDPDLKKSLSK